MSSSSSHPFDLEAIFSSSFFQSTWTFFLSFAGLCDDNHCLLSEVIESVCVGRERERERERMVVTAINSCSHLSGKWIRRQHEMEKS